MARIAVTHPQFDLKGGAEYVSMCVLEELQQEHDVTLFSTVPVSIEELNRYFDVRVSNISVADPPRRCVALDKVVGASLTLFQYALLNRHFRRREKEFDLVVSTFNELKSSLPTVCYFQNNPIYDRAGMGYTVKPDSFIRDTYKWTAQQLAGVTKNSMQQSVTVTNSDWTASVVERTYSTQPQTVYPPVNISEFSGPGHSPEQSERENGFLSIGRIAPDKNILRNVEVIKRLRKRGHEVHLHLIGPVQRTGYKQRVEDEIAGYDFIHLEGAIKREKLIEMIESHRYGIHGKEFEHFGIVIVEMLAGGMIPFVPDSGGQREIVGDNKEVLYDGADEAIEKIDRVLSDPSLERRLLDSFKSIPAQYNVERFQSQVAEIVAKALDRESQRSGGS